MGQQVYGSSSEVSPSDRWVRKNLLSQEMFVHLIKVKSKKNIPKDEGQENVMDKVVVEAERRDILVIKSASPMSLLPKMTVPKLSLLSPMLMMVPPTPLDMKTCLKLLL